MIDNMAASASEAFEAADGLLAFLARYQHGDDGPTKPEALFGGPETERLSRALIGQPMDVCEAVAGKLATGLAQLPDPLAAGWVAVQVGMLVENGMDPAPLAEALLSRLPTDFAAARRFVRLLEAETGVKRPDDADTTTLARIGRKEPTGASAWEALQVSTMAAMTAWCRHRPSRMAAKAVPGLTEDAVFLGSRGGYCWFIGKLLSSADGTQLTVISPEQRKGFVVEIEAVRNAAHLFALLEDALVGDPDQGLLTGPRIDPKVAAIARGEVTTEEVETAIEEGLVFAVGWHYEYWWGIRTWPAKSARGLDPSLTAMIGVEVPVDDLPEFRGQPVMLMRPARFGFRGGDVGFFAPLHDALRSRVTVLRQLPPAEVDTLCDDIRAVANRKWWQFWKS